MRPVRCRVHAPYGSYFRYLAVVGEMHSIQVQATDGSIYYIKLFPQSYGKRTGRGGRITPTTHIEVPWEIVCYYGAEVSLVLGTFGKSHALYVSPPSIFQTIHEFERIRNPFWLALKYIADLLERDGGWFLDKLPSDLEFHYAFEYEDVERYCPELLKGVPELRKSADPAKVVLYLDKSKDKSQGQGIWDYETTSRGIASDVFAILEVERKRLIGGRKTLKPKVRKMPRRHRPKRKFPLAMMVEQYLGAGPAD